MSKRIKILIVDDELVNLRLMRSILEPDYDLCFAEDGIKALTEAKASSPDLILMDVLMPNMNGYTACQQLKADKGTADIPVIFISALGDFEDEKKGLEAGAIDYIRKPISVPIVIARINNYVALINKTKEVIQNNDNFLFEQSLIENIITRMRVSDYQNLFNLQILEIPALNISGDIVLSAIRPDGGQHILLGDFTGHGLAAGICAPMVSELFYRLTQEDLDLENIINRINYRLYKDTPAYFFMATSAVEINRSRNQIKVWNCSAPNILLFSDGKLKQIFKSTYLACGVDENIQVNVSEISVKTGDFIFMFSDGVTEAMNSEEKMFGQERLISTLIEHINHDKPIQKIKEIVQDFIGKTKFGDDFTLIKLTC
ncbi:MAG: fused response regulator/phosphatase [Gammaproteobacteria bacterium]|nr:fused response regulator/phosphatase [Gammaproteobacteria bacterium]